MNPTKFPLVATRRRFFNPLIGNNQLATIADVNAVYDNFANKLYYDPQHISLVQVNQGNPTFKTFVAGDTECPHSCSSCADCCQCVNFYNMDPASAAISTITRTGVGVYLVTFNQRNASVMTNRGIATIIDSFANPNHKATVDKSLFATNKTATIHTYDFIAGAYVAADNILSETVIAFNIYAYTKF